MKNRRQLWLRAGIALNILLIAVLAGYVLSLSLPSTEAVRLRNALLLDIGVEGDYTWSTKDVPASFKAETHAAASSFRAIVAALGVERLSSDWDKALVLADHLTRNARTDGPIQSDLETSYREIVDAGRGYCADFTQVYLGLAHAAGLFAREWAFSLDGFGGHGHAFVEIFDRQRGKWLWLDVHNNVHAVEAVSEQPLSADEFRRHVKSGQSAVVVRRNGPGPLGYSDPAKLLDYYRRGEAQWYLWWGNAVFTYDSNPLVRIGYMFGPAAEQLIAIATGVHPRIRVVPTQANAAALEHMAQLRLRLQIIAAMAIFLALALIGQLWLAGRRSWRERASQSSRVVVT